MKISLERGDKQAFSETAGTAQEVITTSGYQSINQLCFIDIDEALFTKFLKVLYADRYFTSNISFIFSDTLAKVEKYSIYIQKKVPTMSTF